MSIQELVVDASNPSLCQIFNIILKRSLPLFTPFLPPFLCFLLSFHRAMEESLHRIGRNYYDLDKRMSLNPQLDRLIRVLPGFQTVLPPFPLQFPFFVLNIIFRRLPGRSSARRTFVSFSTSTPSPRSIPLLPLSCLSLFLLFLL